MHLRADEVRSVGGLVFSRLGRPAGVGDVLDADGWRLRVEDVRGTRIVKVRCTRA